MLSLCLYFNGIKKLTTIYQFVNIFYFTDFFQDPDIRKSLSNILFLFAKAHPDLSYKQVNYFAGIFHK